MTIETRYVTLYTDGLGLRPGPVRDYDYDPPPIVGYRVLGLVIIWRNA